MINAILIDYEFNALTNLKWEIELFCPEVNICDMFSNPLESISAINKLKPDCVFLDIETPKEELLPFLNQLNFKGFDLVITTTYTHYASNIFNKNSLEHILKPIDSDEFIKVIGKIKKHKNDKNLGHTLQQTIIHLLQQK